MQPVSKIYHFYKDSFRGLSKQVWLLSAVMLVNRSGAMVVPFLTLYLTVQLGFSKADAGWIMGAYGAGSITGTYIGGMLTNQIGFYRVQLFSLLGTAIMFWVLVTIQDFWAFATVIFLTSLVADIFRPANMVAVGAYSKSENRTRSFALVRLAINLGYAIGPAVGGFIILYSSYKWLFVIDGATCALAALAFFYFLPAKDPEQPDKPAEALSFKAANAAVFRNKPFLFFFACTFLTAFVFLQLLSVLPVYWEEVAGLSESEIGLLFTLNCLFITLFEMPIVYIFEKRSSLLPIIAVGVFLIGLTYMTNLLGAALLWVLISVLLITVGEILNMPFATSLAMQMAKENERGTYMSFYSVAWSIAFMVSPVIAFNIIMEYGYNWLWLADGIIALAATIGLLLIRRVYVSHQNAEEEIQ